MFVFILLLWIIFNGRLALDVVVSGILVSAAITFFAVRFCNWGYVKKWNGAAFFMHVPGYAVLLLREILLSNLQMIRLILSPKMKERIQPQLVRFKVDMKDPVVRTLLANSITLTPGTLTILMEDEHFIIHALCPQMGEGMETSPFYHGCERLEECTGNKGKEK